MNHLDPVGAALYAIVAICLVLIGGLLVTSVLSAEQRGTILAGVIGTLFLVAWRYRRGRDGGDPPIPPGGL